MIQIYGTDMCRHCVSFKAGLDANGAEYDFRDISKNLKDMSEFIKIRDLNGVFDAIKGTGTIGIPAIVTEDGSVTLDWEGYLKDNGYKVIQ